MRLLRSRVSKIALLDPQHNNLSPDPSETAAKWGSCCHGYLCRGWTGLHIENVAGGGGEVNFPKCSGRQELTMPPPKCSIMKLNGKVETKGANNKPDIDTMSGMRW